MSSKLLISLLVSLFSCAATSSQIKTPKFKITDNAVMLELPAFDEDTISALKAKITEQRLLGHEVIIRVNTHGGSVAGLQDLTQFLEKHPVICVVDTRALSAGAFFVESRSCSERYITKRSFMLFHEANASVQGNSHEMENVANELKVISKALIYSAAERMGMKESDFLERVTNKEWMLEYHDALKFNAVDGVYWDPKDLPEITPYEVSSLSKLLGM